MVKKEIFTSRLNKLDEYVRLLERLRDYPREAILQDPLVYGNVERYLQLAIQTVIDISNHILAERKVLGVTDYRALLQRLGTEGIISKDLAEKIAPMAGLRNILVHEYLSVDRGKLYEILQKHLGDLKEFGRQVAKLV